ncbi:MAG: sodium:proton antiporter [Gammaproteobacteria bacterium]|nr:sodium:proton antiporter [Gammaproteobacteria bacterium]
MYEDMALLAIFILIYSSVAGRVERSWISGPMIFTCFGLLISPSEFGLLSWNVDGKILSTLAEITLAMVLFTDASSANFSVLKSSSILPSRLLFIGLPLTILLGFGFGTLIFDDASIIAIALLATMLAPTDAALGKAVISNTAVPDKVRQTLNVESGLNDGICVPVLLIFLTIAQGDIGENGTGILAIKLVLEQIGIGLLVGLLIAFTSVQLLKLAWQQKWLTPTWRQIPVVAMALACFTMAQHFGGSGFIAAFCGGLLFGFLEENQRDEFLQAAEGTGDTLALITWIIFGAVIADTLIHDMSWSILLYAVLSLTVIRMLPVFLALTGSGISTEGKLFIGWFGPRGLASIVFAVIVIDSKMVERDPIILVVACTIILSIIAHGITANPWAKAYGKRRAQAQQKNA